MSKIHDALAKVRDERQGLSRPALVSSAGSPARSPVSSGDNKNNLWRIGIGYGTTAILLIVAVTGSVLVNFKTMAQLENAGAATLVLSRQMEGQKRELAAIRRYWMKAESVREDQREQIIVLQKDLKGLKRNLEEAKFNLVRIEDLRVNDKLLLEKFIALNDRVKKMEEIKQ